MYAALIAWGGSVIVVWDWSRSLASCRRSDVSPAVVVENGGGDLRVSSVSATTVTTASSGAPVQYVQAPRPKMQFVQGSPSQIVQTTTGASTGH